MSDNLARKKQSYPVWDSEFILLGPMLGVRGYPPPTPTSNFFRPYPVKFDPPHPVRIWAPPIVNPAHAKFFLEIFHFLFSRLLQIRRTFVSLPRPNDIIV